MYLTHLPDHSKPGFDETLHFENFKKFNVICNANSNFSICERHVGCLSIKTVFSGEEWYGVENQFLAVRPGRFLILNADQEYSSHIDAETRTISVFFKKEFVAVVFRDLLINAEKLLDDDPIASGNCIEFFQTLYEMNPPLDQMLKQLITSLDKFGYDENAIDEYLIGLLRYVIATHAKEAKLAGNVDAIKPATKKEIYKRLCIAKDFMHSNFMHKTNLSCLSHASCLSIPQLVRQFKEVFRNSPHKYLTKIRLSHAATLLNDTILPVREVREACGFEDDSSFCRLFKNVYDVSPLQFREMK